MFQSIGPLEIIIVLAIILVIFGPKRLPQLGKSLGSGMREFKDSITNRHDDDEDDERPAITATKADEVPTVKAAEPVKAEPAAAAATPRADEAVSDRPA